MIREFFCSKFELNFQVEQKKSTISNGYWSTKTKISKKNYLYDKRCFRLFSGHRNRFLEEIVQEILKNVFVENVQKK